MPSPGRRSPGPTRSRTSCRAPRFWRTSGSPASPGTTTGACCVTTDRSRTCSRPPESVGLLGKADELAANLSHGEQRNLEIGIALATKPKLLCLDEPTAGMSVTETHATVDLVRRIARDLTILIVEHDMEVVMGLAHTITVLNYGEVLAEGRPTEIQANPRVQEVYLKT
jgi:ABC-type branched-subunit amino acid transport system ATPase component